MELVDFISETNNCNCIDEVRYIFLKFLNAFGINHFVMVDLLDDPVSCKDGNLGIIESYPDEIVKYYTDTRKVDCNPIIQKAIRSGTPFLWQEIQFDDDTKTVLQVIEETSLDVNCSGIGVSIHKPMGKVIGIGFSGLDENSRSDKDAISLINAAANHFYMIYSGLANSENDDNCNAKLTDREQKVLSCIARGKSKSDTAKILSVSESSIKRHCENIFTKLEVKNLPSAVAKALKMGLINPF